MKMNRIIIIAFMFLAILAVSAVNASAVNETSDELAISDEPSIKAIDTSDNEILSTGNESFSDIQTMIDNANDDDTISLSGKYFGNGTQITISKNVTIDGKGATLNANKLSRIFTIESKNVTLKNINFIDAYSSDRGGAIYNAGDLHIVNCNFTNSTCNADGINIFCGGNLNIVNSNFINGYGRLRGSIYSTGNLLFENSCILNSSSDSGAIYCTGNVSLINSNFTSCKSEWSGSVMSISYGETIIKNCNMVNCSSKAEGGAIDLNKKINITDCNFTNCTSPDNGGAVSEASCINCIFTDCSANNGGAVAGDGFCMNCTFINCSAKNSAGAVISSPCTNCSFMNCSAKSSGAYLGDYALNCNFTNCFAELSGGAMSTFSGWSESAIMYNTFINCSSNEKGGAVYAGGSHSVNHCTLINCSSGNGGAVYLYDFNEKSVVNSEFINCSSTNGGAIYRDYSGGYVENCSFYNCTALENGGAIFWKLGDDEPWDPFRVITVENCTFERCSAGVGDSIIHSVDIDVNRVNCSYINSSINRKNPYLTVYAPNINVGETAEILVGLSETEGYVNVTINNETQKIKLNPYQFYEITSYKNTLSVPNLKVGNYTVVVSFEGNVLYLPVTKNVTFTVFKANPKMAVNLNDIEYGDNQNINALFSNGATGYVNFTLFRDGKIIDEASSIINNGVAASEFSNLSIGEYDVNICYSGDSNNNESSLNSTFIVRPKVTIAQGITVGNDCRISIEFGNATGTILIYLDGVPVSIETILDNKIDYMLPTDNVTARNHTLTFQYYGNSFDKNLLNCLNGNAYTPMKYNMYLLPKNLTIPYTLESDDEGMVILTFEENATGTIEVFVNGVKAKVVEIVNGIAKIDLSKYKDGNYNLTFKYSGDEIYASLTKVVNVYFKVARITASNMNVLYAANGKFTAKVYDSNGKLVNGIKVTFLINKKLYKTATTNSNGIASVPISKTPGTYKIMAKASGISVEKTLTVKHIITLKSVTVKKSVKKLVLSATLAKVNKKYLKNKKVAFKFNGKTYNAKTDKKGVAKVTIKSSVLKKLKAGKKVTYQATYLKDTVKKTVKVKK